MTAGELFLESLSSGGDPPDRDRLAAEPARSLLQGRTGGDAAPGSPTRSGADPAGVQGFSAETASSPAFERLDRTARTASPVLRGGMRHRLRPICRPWSASQSSAARRQVTRAMSCLSRSSAAPAAPRPSSSSHCSERRRTDHQLSIRTQSHQSSATGSIARRRTSRL